MAHLKMGPIGGGESLFGPHLLEAIKLAPPKAIKLERLEIIQCVIIVIGARCVYKNGEAENFYLELIFL